MQHKALGGVELSKLLIKLKKRTHEHASYKNDKAGSLNRRYRWQNGLEKD